MGQNRGANVAPGHDHAPLFGSKPLLISDDRPDDGHCRNARNLGIDLLFPNSMGYISSVEQNGILAIVLVSVGSDRNCRLPKQGDYRRFGRIGQIGLDRRQGDRPVVCACIDKYIAQFLRQGKRNTAFTRSSRPVYGNVTWQRQSPPPILIPVAFSISIHNRHHQSAANHNACWPFWDGLIGVKSTLD